MEKQFLSYEIVANRSTDKDAVSQEMIEKCISIAHQAHAGQRDRDGNLYGADWCREVCWFPARCG